MNFNDLNFVRTIAHEFRTPLNSIHCITQLITQENIDTNTKKKLAIINENCAYLNDVLKDIIELCKITASEHIEEKDDVIDFQMIIKKMVNSYTCNYNKNAFVVENSINRQFRGNLSLINRIIGAALNNSISYTTNGIIKIKTEMREIDKEYYGVVISIVDSIKGIDQEKRRKTFNHSFVDKNNANNKLNLGFHLLKRNISKCNGKIVELPTINGNGKFTFEIKLPLSGNKTSPTLSDSTNCKRMLLVEDDILNQIITKKIIEKRGIHCDTASNGEEAVNLVIKHSYDLILMDLMMPVMDGYLATKKIKNIFPEISIVAFTAISDFEELNNFKQLGFSGILKKPFEIEELFKLTG